jgi:hypothetical protein
VWIGSLSLIDVAWTEHYELSCFLKRG